MKDFLAYIEYIKFNNILFEYFMIFIIATIISGLFIELIKKTGAYIDEDTEGNIIASIVIIAFIINFSVIYLLNISPGFIKKIYKDQIKCNTLIDLHNNDYVGNICHANNSLMFSFNKNFFNLKLPPSSKEIDKQKLKNGLVSISKEIGIPIDKNEIMNMPTSIIYDKNDNTIITFYMKNTKDSLDTLQKFFIKNRFSATNSCDTVSNFYMPSGLFGDRIYYYNDFHCNRSVFVSKEGHKAIYNKKLSLELLLYIPNLYYKKTVYNLKNNLDKLKDFIDNNFLQRSDELSKMHLKIKSIEIKNKLIKIKLIKNDGFSHNEIKDILTTLIDGVGVID